MLIVKVGGGENTNWDLIGPDLKDLIAAGEQIILVHGASTKRDEIAKKLGAETKYITSPSGHKGVYTDPEALDILTMVYAGLVNKKVVAKLQSLGVNAVGLSGADGLLLQGKRKTNILSYENGKTKVVNDTFTGKAEKANTHLINTLLNAGYTPVITQPAISYDFELINTDNDRNLAVLAGELGVEKIVVLFEAAGLLKDPSDEKSLVKKVSSAELDTIMKTVSGRMQKKVLGAKESLEKGVKKVYWGDSRIEKPVTSALAENGTVIS